MRCSNDFANGRRRSGGFRRTGDPAVPLNFFKQSFSIKNLWHCDVKTFHYNMQNFVNVQLLESDTRSQKQSTRHSIMEQFADSGVRSLKVW